MLTSTITNDHFQNRVLSLLNSYTQTLAESQDQPLPLIPALDNFDTPLTPNDIIGQLVAFTSSWIDLSSPDPIISHLSRQVFHLEVAYAAFCGVTNLVIPGPRLAHGQTGVSQYARSIKEALVTGSYIQLHIQMPMDGRQSDSISDDMGDLARFARQEFEASTDERIDRNAPPVLPKQNQCKHHQIHLQVPQQIVSHARSSASTSIVGCPITLVLRACKTTQFVGLVFPCQCSPIICSLQSAPGLHIPLHAPTAWTLATHLGCRPTTRHR